MTKAAAPTWPLVAFCSLIAVIAVRAVSFTHLQLQEASFETVAKPAAGMLPQWALLLLRLLTFALVVFSLQSSLRDRTPHKFTSVVWPGSKLQPVSMMVQGFARLSTFTVQCWVLQGVYFGLASGITMWQMLGLPSDGRVAWLVAATSWFAFEVSLPCAILTTAIVTFVLVPMRARAKDWTTIRLLLLWRPQLMHNANLVFMVNELLFGSISARDEHFWIVLLWGLHYVLVSWFWLRRRDLPVLAHCSRPPCLFQLTQPHTPSCLGIVRAGAALCTTHSSTRPSLGPAPLGCTLPCS